MLKNCKRNNNFSENLSILKLQKAFLQKSTKNDVILISLIFLKSILQLELGLRDIKEGLAEDFSL